MWTYAVCLSVNVCVGGFEQMKANTKYTISPSHNKPILHRLYSNEPRHTLHAIKPTLSMSDLHINSDPRSSVNVFAHYHMPALNAQPLVTNKNPWRVQWVCATGKGLFSLYEPSALELHHEQGGLHELQQHLVRSPFPQRCEFAASSD